MLFAALTFWLMVIIFTAWGVHRLWSSMIKPRVVNGLLLPGTLVAQLGHVLGLLITGNQVRNTALMGDDESGEPQSDTPETEKIPIVGSILVGLLPLVACAACLYASVRLWGGSVMRGLSGSGGLDLPATLPLSLPAVWELLRTCVSLSEAVLNAVLQSNLMEWQSALFLYLAVCLTVRMAPFEGNRRGSFAAIALTGVTVGIIASITPTATQLIEGAWPILSFAVGMLLLLLLCSLLVYGVVGLVRVLVRNE